MVRRLLLIVFAVVCGACVLSAQDGGAKGHKGMMKELMEFKLKYLAQEMELTPEQQEKFVPLYNEMSEKRRQCMKAAWRLEKKVKNSPDATEADYEAAADAMNKAKAEDAAIEKTYDDKFSQFLSQKQIYKMKAAEMEFRKKLEEMRSKKRQEKKRK